MLNTKTINSYLIKWNFSKGAIHVEEYGEHYIIEVTSCTYKIIEILDSGKLKTRRIGIGSLIKGKRDQFGNQFYKSYTNSDMALSAARNYIDNHIKRFKPII